MANAESVDKVRVVSATGLGAANARGYIVRNAGCPDERHPMSKCGCGIFKSKAEAQTYADELRAAVK